MLKELNLNEMEMVSGGAENPKESIINNPQTRIDGVGSDDTIILTGQQWAGGGGGGSSWGISSWNTGSASTQRSYRDLLPYEPMISYTPGANTTTVSGIPPTQQTDVGAITIDWNAVVRNIGTYFQRNPRVGENYVTSVPIVHL